MRILSLATVLCGFWFASSGRTDGLLMGFMLVGCVLVMLLALRLRLLDGEGHPTHLIPRALAFWGWLIGQVVISNLQVIRVVLAPAGRLRPQVVRMPLSQRDDLGRTILANSITLTPGTVTLDVEPDAVVVHCLTAQSAASLLSGDMDRRVTRVAGGRS